ncbi:hypothetical protein [Mycobacterium sp. D16Q16]|uniref:hypothetical protein n=1 Tax=Mycobacterium sp. D16Q16 TaxID=1855659 RepID=UPI000991F44B|nr:hypothetical protein [Mycobacterium sp. D16Q16]
MSRYHIALTTAAAAAAAALLSACSPTEPKPWPSAGQAAAAPTSATVLPAGSPEKPAFTWQDVTGQGVEARRDSNPLTLAQYGAVPVPGIQVQHAENGEMHLCTIGPAVVPAMSQQVRGFLTAGHCAPAPGGVQQWLQHTPDGDPTPLAPATGSGDTVAVWTAAVPTTATLIADTWPVAGVLTVAGVQQLVPEGAMVCVNGARTGVKCGPRGTDEDGMITYDVATLQGDSGAPVFVVDQQNRAVLVGIHQDGNGFRGFASYLDPALRSVRVQIAAGVAPLRGEGFSARTTAGNS